MTKSRTNAVVDPYFRRATQWREVMEKLRTILLRRGLTEELKWGKPCYSFQNGKIVLIQGFKKYCALLFFKGALLKNHYGVLVKTGPNTHVGRQIRFTTVRELVENERALKSCLEDAIEVEKAGLEVPPPKKTTLRIPEEFKNKLNNMPALKKAFDALTPGRQRAYVYFLSGAKQSKTRESRIEKCVPKILKGKGLIEYK